MNTLPPTHPAIDVYGYKCFSGQCPELTVVSDPTSPGTHPNVFNLRYPAGWVGDGTQVPARFTAGVDFGGKRRLYSSLYVKWSANWTNKGAAGTKLMFPSELVGNSQNHFIYGIWSESPFIGGLTTQCSVGGCGSTQFLASGTVPAGQWYLLEMLLEMNTPGVANGVAKLWRDGVLVVDASNVMWRGTLQGGETDANTSWDFMWMDPIFGGGGSLPLTADQYLRIEDWYTSVGD